MAVHNHYKYEIVPVHGGTNTSQDAGFSMYMLGDTVEEAEQTFNTFRAYINNMAALYVGASGIDKEELFGDALIALARAKKDFNIRMGSFIPFAKFIIIDSMNECVRRNRTLIKVPSYVNKANILINKIKNISEGYCNNMHEVLFDNVNKIEKMPDEIKKIVTINKKLLASAAVRANLTYDDLVERSEFIPIEINEQYDSDIENISYEPNQETLLNKIVVADILPLLTTTEREVADLLMRDLNRHDVGKALKRSDDWVLNRMKSIKTKIIRRVTHIGGYK